MAPRLTLMAMPPEIIIEIYVQLSNFRDVFALVAACRRFSAVWCENATSIYRALAPSEIGFLELARQLLADQGGAPTNSDTLTANDVRRMVRNSYKANKAAGVFGQEVAPKTGSFGFYYTPPRPTARHPPGLSQTEYPRFIRAYYRACSLLELGPSRWEERYKSFTLRQLYRTAEMIHLNYPIGEEILPDPPEILPYSFAEASLSRAELNLELDLFQCDERKRIHGQHVPTLHFPSVGRMRHEHGGVDGFITIWDHFQADFYQQVVFLFNPGNTPRPYDEYMREVIWGDSSDEETYRRKYRPPRRRRRQHNQS